ncbi:MAG: hypothetical protein NTW28_33300 [Candidatus Solibacter sp.]|nr:hypothetical protein [Candidatus Solibacter sp.]
MAEKGHYEAKVAHYLLGRLSDGDLARFEEQLAADDGQLARVAEVEQELIRDFLRDHLSWWHRRRFRQRLRTSEDLREKTDAAEALMAALSERSAVVGLASEGRRGRIRRPPFGPVSLLSAVAGGVVLCALAWLAVDDLRVRREVNALHARSAEATATPEPLFSFLLSPVLVKGEAQPPRRVRVAGNSGRVRLRLEVPNLSRFRQYRAVLRAIDGGYDVGSGAGGSSDVTPSAGLADAYVPVSSLPPNDYILLLRGLTPEGKWEDVESYSFGVTR